MVGKKKKSDDATPDGDEAPKEKSGLSRMIMVGVLSLSIASAGYFIGGGGGNGGGAAEPAAAEAEEAPVEVEEKEPEIEKIVDLDPVNVNLTDAHYLRVAISLGVAEEHHDDEEKSDGGGGHGAPAEEEEPEFPTAPAADLLLTTFSQKSMAELSEPSGRAHAREELEHHLKEYYGEEVLVSVFFTEFVMQ